MDDMLAPNPDHARLFNEAASWRGYFTNADAQRAGFSRSLLRHYADSGRFIRVRRGLYRFRDFPSMPYDEIVEAVFAIGREEAVVSHESALELLELSDIIADAIHISVPRVRRYTSPPPGVLLHTRTTPYTEQELVTRHGLKVTSGTRSIVDCVAYGSPPDQMERAIREAITRGLSTPRRLADAAEGARKDVRAFIERVLASSVS